MTEQEKQTKILTSIDNNLKFFFWVTVAAIGAGLVITLSQIA